MLYILCSMFYILTVPYLALPNLTLPCFGLPNLTLLYLTYT